MQMIELIKRSVSRSKNHLAGKQHLHANDRNNKRLVFLSKTLLAGKQYLQVNNRINRLDFRK